MGGEEKKRHLEVCFQKVGGGKAVVEKVNDTWAAVRVCLSTVVENCAFTGFLMRDIEIVS